MTPENLAAIKARYEAATPGPWRWVSGAERSCVGPHGLGGFAAPSGEVCDFGDGEEYYPVQGAEPTPADATFIAHARTDIPALVADVERLRKVAVYQLSRWARRYYEFGWACDDDVRQLADALEIHRPACTPECEGGRLCRCGARRAFEAAIEKATEGCRHGPT